MVSENKLVREVWLFRVDKLEERTSRIYVRGAGEHAEFAEQSLGWFITCGKVVFGMGRDRPDLAIGDVLELRKRSLP